MNKVEAIIRPERLSRVISALAEQGFAGLNIANVTGRGEQRGITHAGRSGETYIVDILPKIKLELVVSDADTQKVISTIVSAARTGEVGDGKIFIIPVSNAIRVRTGESGEVAI